MARRAAKAIKAETMSDCCSTSKPTAPATAQPPSCPHCGEKGRPVQLITLRSLLDLGARLCVGEGPYQFCSSPTCDIVYFGGRRNLPLTKADLTVRVGIKETTAPRPVCYCFNHTIEEIDDELRRTGRTTVLDDIKTRMKVACWCETKSPSGSCCLATVTKQIKAATARLGAPEPMEQT